MEGKETQDPWELNYDVGPESWFTPEVEQWRYIAGLSSWKQTALRILLIEKEGKKEKQIARATVAYQVPGDMLICLNNETTSGKTAMTGAYNNPLSFSKIHLSSEQAKEASWMGIWCESPSLRPPSSWRCH